MINEIVSVKPEEKCSMLKDRVLKVFQGFCMRYIYTFPINQSLRRREKLLKDKLLKRQTPERQTPENKNL